MGKGREGIWTFSEEGGEELLEGEELTEPDKSFS